MNLEKLNTVFFGHSIYMCLKYLWKWWAKMAPSIMNHNFQNPLPMELEVQSIWRTPDSLPKVGDIKKKILLP